MRVSAKSNTLIQEVYIVIDWPGVLSKPNGPAGFYAQTQKHRNLTCHSAKWN